MGRYEIRIPMRPVPKGRPFMGKGRAFTPKRTRTAEETLRWAFLDAGVPRLAGPVKLVLTFVFTRPKSKSSARPYPTIRPDLDNLVKTVKDAGNEILWDDDCQIVNLHAFKRYGPTYEVIVQVEELPV